MPVCDELGDGVCVSATTNEQGCKQSYINLDAIIYNNNKNKASIICIYMNVSYFLRHRILATSATHAK